MKGTTLIEVLIALAAAVVVITAVTILSVSSLNNVQFVRNQDSATKYAQEGMEIVRSIRNGDYVGFRAYSGLYCLPLNDIALTTSGSCGTPNIEERFIRSVQIDQNAGCGVNLVRATVTVAWTDGKCSSGTYCHNSTLTSCLSTVNPIAAP